MNNILRLPLVCFLLFVTIAAAAEPMSHQRDSVWRHGHLYVNGYRVYADTAIWQGMHLKIDLFNPLLEGLRSKGKLQTYEVALNARLKNRYYPTLELGYAFGKTSATGTIHDGQGGFMRVGIDINGLKRHPESPHALLVGVRLGTAYQEYSLSHVKMNDTYWQAETYRDFLHQTQTDVWGEVLGGCQVVVASGFTMGWYLRFKVLFTRKATDGHVQPYYIPGFGYRDNVEWGFNYYVGWKF